MCSLSPCRMMLYLPETCPSLLIMLADLVTLVIQINVFGFLFFVLWVSGALFLLIYEL